MVIISTSTTPLHVSFFFFPPPLSPPPPPLSSPPSLVLPPPSSFPSPLSPLSLISPPPPPPPFPPLSPPPPPSSLPPSLPLSPPLPPFFSLPLLFPPTSPPPSPPPPPFSPSPFDGQYARLGAQGFYWTASESDPVSAWLYNFGQGGLSLNRHEPTVTKRTLPPPSVDGLGPQHRFQVEHSCQRTGDSALLVTLMVTLNPPSEVTSVRQAGGRVETGPSSQSTLAEQR